jgi:hypothetical protein
VSGSSTTPREPEHAEHAESDRKSGADEDFRATAGAAAPCMVVQPARDMAAPVVSPQTRDGQTRRPTPPYERELVRRPGRAAKAPRLEA